MQTGEEIGENILGTLSSNIISLIMIINVSNLDLLKVNPPDHYDDD